MLPVKEFPKQEGEAFVVTCSRKGKIKKTDLLAYTDFDIDTCKRLAREQNPNIDIICMSATKGDGIKAKGVDTISFLGVRAAWTEGLKETNGAYGLYPVQSKNVLIDGCCAR